MDCALPYSFPKDVTRPSPTVAKILEPFLQAIIQSVRPEKIILFGSHAYGEPRPDSDVDLLVIRRGIQSELSSNLEIRRALRVVPGVPPAFTLISKTPEILSKRLAEGSPFLQEVMTRGIELYAA
jgi:predicted nucleotidyltransferase